MQQDNKYNLPNYIGEETFNFWQEYMKDLYSEIDQQRSNVAAMLLDKWGINVMVFCYYCEECGTFGRSNTPKEGKHTIYKFILRSDIFKQIKEGFPYSTEHGSGNYIKREELEQKLFEILL